MSQPDDESNAEVDTASGAPPERRRGTGLLLLTVLVLAAAATVVLVLADNPRWLRLGVVVALWAALVGAFVAVRYRRQVADQHDELDDLAAEHRLELEREAITRREHELRVAEQAQQARQHAQAENDRQLAELRAELRALRQNLEALLGGEVLVERVALRAESTTMRPLSGARMMGMPERLGGFTGVDGHRQLGDRLGYADTAAESRRAESNGKADAGQWFDKRTELVDPVESARRDPVQPAEPVHPVEPMHPVEPASNTARPAESVAAQQHHPLRGRQPRTRPPSTASMSQPAAPVNQPVAPARPAQPSTPAQPAAWPSRPAHDERSSWSATGSSAQLPPISAEFDLDWTPSWEHREPARHEPTDMTRSHHPDTS
ncbi:MAG: hypothetical protein J2O49_09265, partial [Sciscionella sp.]|nr:hypothetical protein [Sciscionella sp.]